MKIVLAILHWGILLGGLAALCRLLWLGDWQHALVLVFSGAAVGIFVYCCWLAGKTLFGDGDW